VEACSKDELNYSRSVCSTITHWSASLPSRLTQTTSAASLSTLHSLSSWLDITIAKHVKRSWIAVIPLETEEGIHIFYNQC